MIVLDASALVEFLVGADGAAERVRAAVAGRNPAVPCAADLECTSVLRGLVRGGRLEEEEARSALELLGRMGLRRYDRLPLLPRVWELRHDMRPYGAVYAALAEVLDADLVTVDAELSTVPGCGVGCATSAEADAVRAIPSSARVSGWGPPPGPRA
ncbi:type II toxin-antitoxin system VapC family toxin [Nocardiopsis sp. CNT-189]|uniref:type II toxin-antitoxin system VapC family toxin n=1 Tax=Nocardiopsis oceanisediminis TaxID=2816862 RepID=UPI003B2D8AA3